MTSHKGYGIVTKADKFFFPGLKALLQSLAIHEPDIPVTVLDCGLTEKQHKYCLNTATDVQKVRLSEFTINQPKYTEAVYSFFVADFSQYNVTLHLDADVIVLGKLDVLFKAAEQHGFAATTDYPPLNLDFQIKNHNALSKIEEIIPNFDKHSIAFNAGVFAVRYDYWNNKMTNILSKILPLHSQLWGNDQAILNIAAFAANPLQPFYDVGIKFNSRPFYRRSPGTPSPHIVKHNGKTELVGIDGLIHILHFIGQPKPWESGCQNSICSNIWNQFYSNQQNV